MEYQSLTMGCDFFFLFFPPGKKYFSKSGQSKSVRSTQTHQNSKVSMTADDFKQKLQTHTSLLPRWEQKKGENNVLPLII